jgi:hypothetical protein
MAIALSAIRAEAGARFCPCGLGHLPYSNDNEQSNFYKARHPWALSILQLLHRFCPNAKDEES